MKIFVKLKGIKKTAERRKRKEYKLCDKSYPHTAIPACSKVDL